MLFRSFQIFRDALSKGTYLKNISIKNKLLLIVFSSIVIVSTIITIGSIKSLKDIVEMNIQKYQEDAYSSKIEELKNYTTTVVHKIKHFHDQSIGKSPAEVKKLKAEALKIISKLRYGKSGYFWVNDSNSVMIMHGVSPKLNGKDLSSLKDPNGVYIFNEMVNVVKAKGEGTIKYVWKKPGVKDPVLKYSYVKHFEPWDMIVGTGVYVDDIEAQVNSMKALAEEKINEEIFLAIIETLIAIIVIGVIVNLIVRSTVIKPIDTLEDGLMAFFKYLNKENSDCKNLDIDSKDEIGKMAKVINQNIVQTKKLIKDDESLIDEVKTVVREVERGHLTTRVNISTSNESLEELKINLNDMLSVLEKTIAKDINSVKAVLDEYSNLNFTSKIDDTSELSNKINDLSKIINDMLKVNLDDGHTLESNAQTLKNNVNRLSTSSNQQAASLEETAAALEEITSTMRNNTSNMVTMSGYADELSDSVKEGQQFANETTVAMDQINEQVTSINEAITVIDQIAFQTNILSLNAAVEAATAGEAGKGFAVVAQEVRNLAARSAEAAKEIKDLVENATTKANEGKDISYKMISGYEGLNESITNTIKIVSNVTSASKEQMQGIEQINDSLTQLDRATQENATVASQTNEIADGVNHMATKIVDSVNEKNFIGKN